MSNSDSSVDKAFKKWLEDNNNPRALFWLAFKAGAEWALDEVKKASAEAAQQRSTL